MANDNIETSIVVHLDDSPIPAESKKVRKELNNLLTVEPHTKDLKKAQSNLLGYRKAINDARADITKLAKTRFTSDELNGKIDQTTEDIKNLEERKEELEKAQRLSTVPKGQGSPEWYAKQVKIAEDKIAAANRQLEAFVKLKEKADATKTKTVIGLDLSKASGKMSELVEKTNEARDAGERFKQGQKEAKALIQANEQKQRELADATKQSAEASKDLVQVEEEGSNTLKAETSSANELRTNIDKAAKSAKELEDVPEEGNLEKTAENADSVANNLDKAKEQANALNNALKNVDLDADVSTMRPADREQYAEKLKTALKSLKDAGIEGQEDTFDKIYDQLIRCSRAASDYKRNLDKVAETTKELPPVDLNADVTQMNIAELMRYMQRLKDLINEIKAQGMPVERDAEYNQATDQLIRAQRAASAYKRNLDAVAESSNRTRVSVASFRKVLAALKGVGDTALKKIRNGFHSLQKVINNVKSSFNKLSNQMHRGFKHNFTNLVKYVFGFRSLFFLVRRVRKYIKEGMENLARYDDKVSNGVKSHNLFNDSINDLRSSLQYLKNAWAAAFAPIIIYVMPALTAMIDKLAVAGNYIAYLTATLLGQSTAYNAVKTAVDDYADSLDNSGSSAKKNANNQDKLNEQLAEYDKLLVIAQKKDNDNGGNNGNGAGADNLPNYQDMFTTISTDTGDIASQLKDAIEKQDWTEFGKLIGDKIVGGITSINWTEIKKKFGDAGKKIGEFIKGLFSTENLGDAIGVSAGEFLNAVSIFIVQLTNQTKDVDFGGGLAGAINGFIEATDWDLIRENIKNVVRQFKTNVTSFLKNLNWSGDDGIKNAFKTLGDAIGSAIGDTLSDTEFMSSLGTTAGELINTISETISGILKGTKDKDIGGGLAASLNAGLSTVDFKLIAKNISNGLSQLFTNISSFMEQTDWDKVGDAVGQFLEGIDWVNVFTTLAKSIVSTHNALTKIFASVGNAVSDYLMNADPDEIADGIKKFIESIDWQGIGDTLGLMIQAIIKSTFATGKVIAAILMAIGQIIGEGAWNMQEAAIEGLTNMMKEMQDQGIEINFWTVLGKLIIDGLLEGLKKAAASIGNWVCDNVITPIVEAFTGKDGFDIHSPSKRAEYWGQMIIEGLKNGLSGIWNSISSIFTSLMTNITNALFGEEQTYKAGSKVWKERVGGIFGFITNKGGLVDKVKEAFDNIKKYIVGEDGKGGIVKTLKDAFSDPLGAIKTSLFDEKNGLMKYFSGDNSIVKKIKHKLGLDDDTIGIVGALKKAFTSPLASVKTALFSENTGLMQYFSGNNSIIKKIKDKLNDSGISDAFKKAFNFNAIFEQRIVSSKLKDSQKTLWEKLFGYTVGSRHINGLLDDLKDKFVSIWTGIKTGIKSPIKAILEMIENVVNACIDGINWLLKKAGSITIAGKSILPSNWTNPLPDFTIDYKAIGLAQGAVIPPNKEFLAVLGDQKQGVNIETPLATMIDAFKTALAEGGGNTNHEPIVLQLDGRTVAQVVWNEEDKKYKQTGFGLAY